MKEQDLPELRLAGPAKKDQDKKKTKPLFIRLFGKAAPVLVMVAVVVLSLHIMKRGKSAPVSVVTNGQQTTASGESMPDQDYVPAILRQEKKQSGESSLAMLSDRNKGKISMDEANPDAADQLKKANAANVAAKPADAKNAKKADDSAPQATQASSQDAMAKEMMKKMGLDGVLAQAQQQNGAAKNGFGSGKFGSSNFGLNNSFASLSGSKFGVQTGLKGFTNNKTGVMGSFQKPQFNTFSNLQAMKLQSRPGATRSVTNSRTNASNMAKKAAAMKALYASGSKGSSIETLSNTGTQAWEGQTSTAGGGEVQQAGNGGLTTPDSSMVTTPSLDNVNTPNAANSYNTSSTPNLGTGTDVTGWKSTAERARNNLYIIGALMVVASVLAAASKGCHGPLAWLGAVFKGMAIIALIGVGTLAASICMAGYSLLKLGQTALGTMYLTIGAALTASAAVLVTYVTGGKLLGTKVTRTMAYVANSVLVLVTALTLAMDWIWKGSPLKDGF